jgi:hypothetical protein
MKFSYFLVAALALFCISQLKETKSPLFQSKYKNISKIISGEPPSALV